MSKNRITALANTEAIFLSDAEFEALFGSDIARITRILNEAAGNTCSACKGKCCRQIECRLYSAKFSSCPIFEIRPRECRYHFCNQILTETPLSPEDKDLLMKPVNELLDSEKGAMSSLFTQFPRFPLDAEGLELLGISEAAGSIMKSFEEGKVDENHASGLLKSLCLKSEEQHFAQ